MRPPVRTRNAAAGWRPWRCSPPRRLSRSGFYPRRRSRCSAPNITVIQQACPELGGMIEGRGAPKPVLRADRRLAMLDALLRQGLGAAPDKSRAGLHALPAGGSVVSQRAAGETRSGVSQRGRRGDGRLSLPPSGDEVRARAGRAALLHHRRCGSGFRACQPILRAASSIRKRSTSGRGNQRRLCSMREVVLDSETTLAPDAVGGEAGWGGNRLYRFR